jgi:hypothetical protein
MPRRRLPPWYVRWDGAERRYAFFVSHVTEDAAEIKALTAAIVATSGRGGRAPLACFLDKHNWLVGNDNPTTIRDCLLQSQHMICWVTPAYLANQRGWIWMELAYANLLETSINLQNFGVRLPYVVPIFRGAAVEQVAQTPLHEYWQRNLVPPGQSPSVEAIARKLVDYYDQEQAKQERK